MSYYYSNNQRRGFLSSAPPVTKNLVIINSIIFIAFLVNRNFMTGMFGLFYPTSPFFHIWQPFTHMFMHGSIWHVFFNMYTLYMFGCVVENIIGSKKFLILFLLSGLGGAGLNMLAQYIEMQSLMNAAANGSASAMASISILKQTPTVGASGAIYGLLIAYAMLFPESKMTLLFPPITLSAKWMVVTFAAFELLFGITGWLSAIAHFAHLGGLLIGWLLIVWWRKQGTLFNKEW